MERSSKLLPLVLGVISGWFLLMFPVYFGVGLVEGSLVSTEWSIVGRAILGVWFTYVTFRSLKFLSIKLEDFNA